jgi:hypothetical protein
MGDVVRYRARANVEDDHAIGTLFFESVVKWNEYLAQKQEL